LRTRWVPWVHASAVATRAATFLCKMPETVAPVALAWKRRSSYVGSGLS
jgi:hypothetical protein